MRHAPASFSRQGIILSWTAVRRHGSTAALRKGSRQLCPHRPKKRRGERRINLDKRGELYRKKGKLCFKLLIAAALLFTLTLSIYTPAANPFAFPTIVADKNFSNSNISHAFANNMLFGHANFTSQNGTFESNSTFKWYKRTLYQPQNRSLVGYLKLDGSRNGRGEVL